MNLQTLGISIADPFTAAIDIGLTEAEDLDIEGGFKVVGNSVASGNAYLQATAAMSSAGGVFVGGTGTYDLTVGYFDETDGVSRLEVSVNGLVVDAFDWDAATGSAIASPASRAEFVIADIALATGDIIALSGMRDGGEPLRTDYVEIVPVMAPPPPPVSLVIEAEDLTIISGFRVVSNGAASGNETLQDNLSGSAPSRASYTVTDAGTFDLTIGYFDENDGVSSLSVLVNGTEVDFFLWDGLGGSSIANGASAAERTISGLTLEAGDVIELAGRGNGGEPLRLDYLRFDGTVAPPPPPPAASPDVWYEDGNDVIVAFNDGTGGFNELDTGINLDGADVLSGDFDDDGDVDFVKIGALGDPVPAATPGDETFDVELTLYRNEGDGAFAADPSQVFTIVQPERFEDFFRFVGEDTGDLDGDGTLDIIASDGTEGALFQFTNDGTGMFSFAARSPTGLIDIDSVLLGDMNDDGLADAIVFNGPGETTVDVYLNDGAGGMIFADSIAPSIGTNTDGQIVDLDGDGDLDVLFAANEEGRGIYGYINDGTGVRDTSGTPSISEDEDGTIGVSVAADFDGDGMVEVVTAGSFADDGTARGLRVFDVVTTATGVAFVLKSTDTSIVGNAVAFGDFDGDTDLDILLTPPNSAPGDPDLSLLVNDGAGNFTNAGQVIPSFDTSQFSFAPIVTVEDFGDVLFL